MARAAGFYLRLSVAHSVSTADCIRPEVSPHKLDGDHARNAALSSVLPVTPAELHPARSKWDGEVEGCEHRHWKCPLLPSCSTGLLPGAGVGGQHLTNGNLLSFFPQCALLQQHDTRNSCSGDAQVKSITAAGADGGIWAVRSGGHRSTQAVRPPCFNACHVKPPFLTFLNWSTSAAHCNTASSLWP